MPRSHHLLAALLPLAVAACAAPQPSDDPAIEDTDPLALAWVAPLASDAVAAGDPVTFAVATENPAAHVVHFEVDGREVDVCDPAADPAESAAQNPSLDVAPDETTPDDAPAEQTIESPTRTPGVYDLVDPDPETDVPEDPPAPADEDVSDDGLTQDADLPYGSCHTGDVFRTVTAFDAPGTHTLRAYFVAADGTTVETSRTVTVAAASSTNDTTDPSASLDDTDDPVTEADLSTEPDDTVVQDILPAGGYRDPNHGFHAVHGGLAWAVQGQRVVFHNGRLDGSVAEVARCMRRYGDSIQRYADLRYVSRASVAALAIAESGCTAHYAGGPLRLPRAACHAVEPSLAPDACLARMNASADFAIDVATRFVRGQRALHHNDPPLLAAVYRSGSQAHGRRDARWHLVAPPHFVDRFVAAYNAYRTWERLGSSTQVYRNPTVEVHGDGTSEALGCADPYVTRVDGPGGATTYYLVSTGGRFLIRRSSDLVHWTNVGLALPASAPARAPSYTPPPWIHDWSRSWAPEIHDVGGGRYALIYAASCGPSSNPASRICIGLGYSDSPAGPFQDIGHPLVSDPAIGVIDPTLYTEGGRTYVYWKTDDNSRGQPPRIWGARLPAGNAAVNLRDARELLHCDRAWEGFNPGPNGHWDGHHGDDGWGGVVEAPEVVAHGGRYYLFYSGNSYTRTPGTQHSHYAEGVAVGASPMGPFHKRRSGPILQRNGAWEGPGHGSVVHAANGQDYFFYHAWRHGHVGGPMDSRYGLLDLLNWGGDGWPHIGRNGTPTPPGTLLVTP